MQLNITKQSMNDIPLNMKKSEFKTTSLNSNGLYIEYIKDKGSKFDPKIGAISTEITEPFKQFVLDNEVIDSAKFQELIKQESPLVDSDVETDYSIGYVFPTHNLSIIVDKETQEFLQIVLYSDDLKSNYEDI